jgi:putative phosphoesterase
VPAAQALLYDIHGNLPALEAVLADAGAAGAERFVLGGDYALFGAFPRETVERLHGLDATWIRGNTDRWLVDDSDAPDTPAVQLSLAYCREHLGDTVSHELASLQTTVELDGTLFCHASPLSDLDTFLPDPEPPEVEQEMLAGATQDVIVFGHSHLQFERKLDGRLLVNPGSVGLPFDGDHRAAYALWRGGRYFDLRRVEYDVATYVVEVLERMGVTLGDSVGTLMRRLEQAAFVN